MPIPLLLGAAAVICTGVGVKKAIDAKYDNDRAEEFNYEAECIFDEAKESLEYERNKTQDILVGLGKLKLEVWDQQLGRFIKTFEQIRNVKFEGQAMTGQLKNNHFTKDELMKMKDISLKAGEVMASGATALGAGALAGVASYGGAMMFATASTGTAISALSGVAATNATLAWFGGGSLAAGGLGIAGGTAVLGGIVAGPVLAVGGMILAAKAKENLANARSNLAKAKRAVQEMNSAATLVRTIGTVAKEFQLVIKKLNMYMERSLDNLEEVVYLAGTDYAQYDVNQRKAVHIAVQFAQVMKMMLETPLLTREGALTDNYQGALAEGRKLIESAQ